MPNLQKNLEDSNQADLLHRGLQGFRWKSDACALWRKSIPVAQDLLVMDLRCSHTRGHFAAYSIHITRRRSGIYSGDTKHLPNHNMYTQNKLRHKHVPVAGVCIGRARQGQHQTAHIHSQMQPLHVPGSWSRSQILFHTYERKCSRHFYTELTAGTKRIYAHTVATAVIACPRDMYLQGVALSEFFVPHDFTPMFCHCSMSRQSSFGRTLCGMLQQRMLQKDDFYRVNSSGACICSFTTDLTNYRQQRNGNKFMLRKFMLLILKQLSYDDLPATIERQVWTREWIKRREELSAYHTLFRELAAAARFTKFWEDNT